MATHVLVHDPGRDRLWSIARWAALAAVPLLLAWLIAAPQDALTALWYLAIPLLPATFFVTTIPWRSVCPLATLNEWGNRIGTQRELPPKAAAFLSAAGLVLFHLMVPARRFLFNANGPALAIAVLAVGGLSLALGSRYAVRSAFCNALCPVLPVELLYGQAPLVRISRGRCQTCTTCTPRGCLDLAQGRAFTQVAGASRSTAWLGRPFGLFIAALPGFIVGYGLTSDGPLSSAPMVYATTLGWSLASLATIALVVRIARADARIVHPLIAGLAGMLYYWFAGPAIAARFGAADAVSLTIRLAGMGLVGYWLLRTLSGVLHSRQEAR